MQAIDPMVFVDDDGSAYLYWGQGRCKAVKLNDDMISFNMADVRDLTPPGYNEGPFVHKRNGQYYLTWSEFDTRDPRYSVAYATGDSPLGPFTKAPDNPILRQSGLVKGAGHHSLVQIPGGDEWVIAYHRFRIPGGNGYNRETFARKRSVFTGCAPKCVSCGTNVTDGSRTRCGPLPRAYRPNYREP
jgi:beta-xylosidase